MIQLFKLGFVVDLIDHTTGPARRIQKQLESLKATALALTGPRALARIQPSLIDARSVVPVIPLARVGQLWRAQNEALTELFANQGRFGKTASAFIYGALPGALVPSHAEIRAFADDYGASLLESQNYLQSQLNDKLVAARRRARPLLLPPPSTAIAVPPGGFHQPFVLRDPTVAVPPGGFDYRPPILVPPGGFGALGGPGVLVSPGEVRGSAIAVPPGGFSAIRGVPALLTGGGGPPALTGGGGFPAIPAGVGGVPAAMPPTYLYARNIPAAGGAGGAGVGGGGGFQPPPPGWNARLGPYGGVRGVASDAMLLGAVTTAAGLVGKNALSGMADAAMQVRTALAFAETAMNDGADTTKHLGEVQRQAMHVSENSSLSTTKLIESYLIARSLELDHAKALDTMSAANKLVVNTTLDAAAANREAVATTRLVASLMHEFGKTGTYWADKLTYLVSKKAFFDVHEVTSAMVYALPVMEEFKLNVDQTLATLAGLSAAGLKSSKGGTTFRMLIQQLGTQKKLAAFAKTLPGGGLDIIGSIDAIYQHVKNLPPLSQARFFRSHGLDIRSTAGLAVLVQKAKETYVNSLDLARSKGESASVYDARLAHDPQIAIKRYTNAVFNLQAALGEGLIPTLTAAVRWLTRGMSAVRGIVEAHPLAAKLAAAFAVLAVATALVVGPIILFGSALLLGLSAAPGAAAGLSFLAARFWPLGFALARVTGLFLFLGRAITTLRVWAVALSPAFWQLAAAVGAFFLTNPIGWAILVVAGLAAVSVVVYKYGATLYNAGASWMKSLANGVVAGATWVVKAAVDVAQSVADFFVGHSPPPRGPLHALDRPGWMTTLAASMDPSPVVAAARSTSLAVHRAFYEASPYLVTPGRDPLRWSAAQRGGQVTINYAPTITVNGEQSRVDIDQMLNDHANDIMSKVHRAMARQERVNY